MQTNTRLRVAVQKSGRLTERSLELMKQCGLRVARDGEQLICYGENLPIDLLLVRDDDIPGLVAEGAADAGIVGGNVAREYAAECGGDGGFLVRRELDFGACRLAIAVPEAAGIRSLTELAGARIATSYPALTAAFLAANGVNATTVSLSGAVELAPRLGKADAICDLVSTGATLRAHQLVELCTVDESKACVIASPRLDSALFERILTRVDGVLAVNGSKYIMLHAPRDRLAEITRLMPGVESPTVLPLEGYPDKVAVHAVCTESVFWETLEDLKSAGASAMLVLPVEKMLA